MHAIALGLLYLQNMLSMLSAHDSDTKALPLTMAMNIASRFFVCDSMHICLLLVPTVMMQCYTNKLEFIRLGQSFITVNIR